MNNDYMFEDEDNQETKDYEGPHYQQNFSETYQQEGQYNGPRYSYVEPGYIPPKDGLGMAVVSMVLGIISLVFFLMGINIIGAIIAIVLGIVYLVKSRNQLGRVFSIVGIVTSVLGIVCCIAAWSFIFSNIDGLANLENDTEGMQEWYDFYGLDGLYDDLEPYEDGDEYIYEEPDGDDLDSLFDGIVGDDEHPEVDLDDTL